MATCFTSTCGTSSMVSAQLFEIKWCVFWVHGQNERGAFHFTERPEKPLKMPRVEPVSGSLDVLEDQHEPGIQYL